MTDSANEIRRARRLFRAHEKSRELDLRRLLRVSREATSASAESNALADVLIPWAPESVRTERLRRALWATPYWGGMNAAGEEWYGSLDADFDPRDLRAGHSPEWCAGWDDFMRAAVQREHARTGTVRTHEGEVRT